ncbi:EAL domain-containing protein [Desulfocurvibacter africanus]|uniref:EAL domain-containing protein n=1 Tax=Desulfocurvibacter africanus TaxID=873 RepID=UPI0004161953|nr:EAL domain-containing protein [Desulfocurvibacter africanus]
MAHEDKIPRIADVSVASILKSEAVLTFFQPLVSLRRKSLFGVEALSRGLIGDSGEAIPPALLFQLAEDKADLANLDRLCRRKALEAFAPMHALSRELFLCLNVEPTTLDWGLVGSGTLSDVAQRLGVDPANVVLELDESRIADPSTLTRFANSCRAAGFLLGLDGTGGPHSGLERIAELRPDIIKIDRRLVSGVHSATHKQDVVRGLIATADRIGALPVAVGVETEEEVILLLELGVEVFQGFYFARPYPSGSKRPDVSTAIEAVAAHFKGHVLRKINASKEQHKIYAFVIDQVQEALARTALPELDAALAGILDMHPGLQCAYVLNESGLQISDTVSNPLLKRGVRRLLHQPIRKGTDHSLKEYYLSIKAGLPRYITDPGISQTTGLPRRTICAAYQDASGRQRILCLDISEPE